MSYGQMKADVTSHKNPAGVKTARKGGRVATVVTAKASRKWRFAPDAIGMFNGPRDLSGRRGLGG